MLENANFKRKLYFKYIGLSLVVLMMMAVGYYFVIASHADTPALTAGLSIPGNSLLYESQKDLDADMDHLNDLGVSWIRFDFIWQDMEPTKGSVNWTNADRVVEAALAHHLIIDGIITTVPAWQRPAGTNWTYGPRTDSDRQNYAAFAKQLASHYGTKVSAYEIWNEANCDQFWAPAPSTSDYTSLLKAAYPAIKSVSQATVLTAGTCGPGPAPDIQTADWFNGIYANGGKNFFDAAAIHPYYNMDNAISGEMANVSQVRSIMDNNGDGAKALWGTEVGAPTGGDNSTSEANQAVLMTKAYDYWATIHDHGPLFYYTLHDNDADTSREGHFGLIRGDSSLKPAYGGLKTYVANLLHDSTPPTTVIVNPVAGSAQSGTVQIAAEAKDNRTVTQVSLYVDGSPLSSATAAPYSFALDTTSLSNGPHYLETKAYDANGNIGSSGQTRIQITNSQSQQPPTVTNLSYGGAPTIGNKLTFNWTTQTAAPLSIDRLIVACRTASGDNCDFGGQTTTNLSGVQNFSAQRSFAAAGTYTYHIAYLKAGTWTDLGPSSTVVISQPLPSVTALNYNGKPLSNSQMTFNWSLQTGGPLKVDRLIVACRTASGANCDFGGQVNVTLNGQQNFSAQRSFLAPGTYTYHIAYLIGSTWTDLGPSKTVVISPPMPNVYSLNYVGNASRNSPLTFRWSTQISAPLKVDRLIVACRTASGANCDFGGQTNVTLNGQQSFSAQRAFTTPGIYTYHIAYLVSGVWTDLGPSKSISIR